MCKCKNDNQVDECLGFLNGVANACCGHGDDNMAYIQFLDGSHISGKDAITIQHILKANSSQCKESWMLFRDYTVDDFEIARYHNEKYEIDELSYFEQSTNKTEILSGEKKVIDEHCYNCAYLQELYEQKRNEDGLFDRVLSDVICNCPNKNGFVQILCEYFKGEKNNENNR